MDHNKKAPIYKYMFLVSTACGVIGIYLLYKQFIVLGWTLISIWAILAVLVRVLIILDKKNFTKK
jgi:energy-converting hydrogenase Eha subunit E